MPCRCRLLFCVSFYRRSSSKTGRRIWCYSFKTGWPSARSSKVCAWAEPSHPRNIKRINPSCRTFQGNEYLFCLFDHRRTRVRTRLSGPDRGSACGRSRGADGSPCATQRGHGRSRYFAARSLRTRCELDSQCRRVDRGGQRPVARSRVRDCICLERGKAGLMSLPGGEETLKDDQRESASQTRSENIQKYRRSHRFRQTFYFQHEMKGGFLGKRHRFYQELFVNIITIEE